VEKHSRKLVTELESVVREASLSLGREHFCEKLTQK
jgi:hypothetical protein